jgi:hypothetical protein
VSQEVVARRPIRTAWRQAQGNSALMFGEGRQPIASQRSSGTDLRSPETLLTFVATGLLIDQSVLHALLSEDRYLALLARPEIGNSVKATSCVALLPGPPTGVLAGEHRAKGHAVSSLDQLGAASLIDAPRPLASSSRDTSDPGLG